MARQLPEATWEAASVPAQERCSVCGRRAPSPAAGCGEHGAIPSLEPPLHEAFQEPFLPQEAVPGYRIVRRIGQGGFGTVFAAEAMGGGPRVAIKVARRDRVDADLCLEQEGRALRAVGPPHVPAVYGSGLLADGSAYLVLEHVTAETLAERLVREPNPIPFAEVAAALDAALAALAAVHALDLVHGDIKPENVFFDSAQGWAKLIDFGLVTDADETTATTTTERPAAGTAE